MEMPSSRNVSTKLERIAALARQMRGKALTSLSHHIDVEFLHEAYRRTRKTGAVGVDGQTAEQYAENLEENLADLLGRFKSGRYQAPPARRVYIPKDGGKRRPIGIPAFEDKVLQQAVSMVLTAVYEQDFLDVSYGFRPGRSQHQALQALWSAIGWEGSWVVELDIKSFFDTLSHVQLRGFLDQRVRDGVIRRAIDKWLKAGIMEQEQYIRSTSGTPQGGVASPVLANIYLHEVLDVWFETMVKPVLGGQAQLIRYADDAVLIFDNERDARRVFNTLPKRFEKFGLQLHPDKTRLLSFRRPQSQPGQRPPGGTKSPTFDFLGFTFLWGKSRRGKWVVKRRTMKARFKGALSRVWQWCRRYRHSPIQWQRDQLALKLRGHYAYYGITTNLPSLKAFYTEVNRHWRFWLNRRGQSRSMPWERFVRLRKRYPLPKPRVVQTVYQGT